MNRKYGLDQVSVHLVKEQPLLTNEGITNPESAVRILADAFRDYDREVVGVVHLRNDNVPINMTIASIGTLNSSLAHPREIMKAAFLSNAASILLFHNHPSGSERKAGTVKGRYCTYKPDAAALHTGRDTSAGSYHSRKGPVLLLISGKGYPADGQHAIFHGSC